MTDLAYRIGLAIGHFLAFLMMVLVIAVAVAIFTLIWLIWPFWGTILFGATMCFVMWRGWLESQE